MKSNLSKLRPDGYHRHVILQAYANLGLPEETERNPDGSRPYWAEGDSERFEKELERIASSPEELAAAIERFNEEVKRRAIRESEERWRDRVGIVADGKPTPGR